MTCEVNISTKTKGTVQNEPELKVFFPAKEMYSTKSTTFDTESHLHISMLILQYYLQNPLLFA